MTDDLDLRLAAAGADLQRAWRGDLDRRRGFGRRSLAFVVLTAILVATGVAAADSLLKSPAEEQTSIVSASTLFAGSDPTCVATSATSYRCTLATTPTGETFFDATGKRLTDVFFGIKEATVNTDHRVDGGCVSRLANGLLWDCYVGQEAVDRGIIGQAFLGAYLQGPAAG